MRGRDEPCKLTLLLLFVFMVWLQETNWTGAAQPLCTLFPVEKKITCPPGPESWEYKGRQYLFSNFTRLKTPENH